MIILIGGCKAHLECTVDRKPRARRALVTYGLNVEALYVFLMVMHHVPWSPERCADILGSMTGTRPRTVSALAAGLRRQSGRRSNETIWAPPPRQLAGADELGRGRPRAARLHPKLTNY
jgi:hypothetical protein